MAYTWSPSGYRPGGAAVPAALQPYAGLPSGAQYYVPGGVAGGAGGVAGGAAGAAGGAGGAPGASYYIPSAHHGGGGGAGGFANFARNYGAGGGGENYGNDAGFGGGFAAGGQSPIESVGDKLYDGDGRAKPRVKHVRRGCCGGCNACCCGGGCCDRPGGACCGCNCAGCCDRERILLRRNVSVDFEAVSKILRKHRARKA